jgi:hypothetical protein
VAAALLEAGDYGRQRGLAELARAAVLIDHALPAPAAS